MKYLVGAVVFLLVAFPAAAEDAVSTVVVPVVGTTIGPGVIWRTDVEVVNDTGSPANVAVELTTAEDSPVRILDLGAGETQRFPDIVGQLFGLARALSPLIVTSNTRRGLTVRATVYSINAQGVTKPQPIAVYHGAMYYPLRALDGLSFTDDLRTNIGLVNFGDDDADFILALQRVPGRNVAITKFRVGPRSLAQTSIQSLFPLISKGTDFIVIEETPSRDTYVYASVIDNDNAGHFIAPRIATR